MSSHTATYPAWGKLPPLNSELYFNAGNMSTVRAGSRTLWWSFSTLKPAVAWTSARANILVDGLLVWMNGSLTMPAWEVHDVLYAADGIKPFNTPFLSCSFVIVPRGGGALEMGIFLMMPPLIGWACGCLLAPWFQVLHS